MNVEVCPRESDGQPSTQADGLPLVRREQSMTTVVLVPGSWEGGWIYHDVATQLRSRGHTVHAITLPGLDGGEPASAPVPNLDDHIDHVVEFITKRDLREVVVAAHSYGGMVL